MSATISIDWAQISTLSGDALKKRVFSIMQEAAISLNSGSSDDPRLLEIVPRLADLIPNRVELSSYREAFSSLARATGLWNYIDRDFSALADQIVAEAVSIPDLDGITLHREQISALNVLMSGKNLILSAPTSFGKSILIDALILSGRYKRIAIILPTIALLDEFRRRLRARFDGKFQLIMHPSDKASDRPTIFLGTQERLISRNDIGKIDLTVVDEFYKLDPTRRDERSATLNAAVYKLLKHSKQFFFIGPNIDSIRVSSEGRWQFEFIYTRFSTVAVDTFDLRGVSDKQERLFDEIERDEHWPALIFVSSPDKANRLASEAAKAMAISDESEEFSDWLSENIGRHCPLVESIRNGFGVHHARIPRAVASQIVRLFNREVLPVLFCTSTLIEGINTAAKTVLIFDKAINRRDYDFFTFSNIRGRAGRLGKHHVGQVFIFNAPPDPTTMEVAPSVFDDEESAPDGYVVHLDEADTGRQTGDRLAQLRADLGVDNEGLRIAAGIGIDIAAKIKSAVAKSLAESSDLIWTGRPNYTQICALINIICSARKPRSFGVASTNQLAFLINKLRSSRSMKSFFLFHDEDFQFNTKFYDSVFKFLRACEYGLPELCSMVEIFVRNKAGDRVNYVQFIGALSHWFRAEELSDLEEEGIPIQISERFHRPGDHRSQLAARILDAAESGSALLTKFEREWIISALKI